MSKMWWFWAILFLLVNMYIAFLPAIGRSEFAYKLYIYNKSKNHYTVQVVNTDTRWKDTVDVSPDSCVEIYGAESGEYTIKTGKNGTMVGDYASFKVRDDNVCIEITPPVGRLELCSRPSCY